jgi:hypothetical protein
VTDKICEKEQWRTLEASTRYELRIFEIVARIETKDDLFKNSCHVSTKETMGDL